MKAATPAQARKFTDVPNVGPRIADDFRRLGLRTPADLAGKDPLALYRKMCRLSGTRQDPCVFDTYMAAVAFMEGKGAKPWWAYTARRKREHPEL